MWVQQIKWWISIKDRFDSYMIRLDFSLAIEPAQHGRVSLMNSEPCRLLMQSKEAKNDDG